MSKLQIVEYLKVEHKDRVLGAFGVGNVSVSVMVYSPSRGYTGPDFKGSFFQ